MKKLKGFNKFDYQSFLKGKAFALKEIRDWKEYKDGEPSGKILGQKVECVIMKDETIYKNNDEVTTGVNLFEPIVFNVPNGNYNIPQKAIVKPINITKANVYGQYQNQLSIECEKVEVVQKNASTN